MSIGVPLKRLVALVRDVDETAELPFVSLENVESGTGQLVETVLPIRRGERATMATAQEGDVLFGKLRPYLAKTLLVRDALHSASELLILRPAEEVESRWLHYVVSSQPFIAWSVATSDGAKMPRTSWSALGDYRVTAATPARQRAVADFLDTETARIDTLIAKKQRLIDLLEARWVASVDRATRVGTQVRVKFVTSLITSGPRGWADRVGDTGAPFIRSGNLSAAGIEISGSVARVEPGREAESARSKVAAGDVMVGITGANTSWVGLVGDALTGGFVSQHVALLRPERVEPEWLAFSLVAPTARQQLLGEQYGGTKQQLGLWELAELPINVPDREEQRRRAESLMREYQNHRSLVARFAQQMRLLREHRQALITAAVTGELELPGFAA